MALLEVDHLSVRFGGLQALAEVSFSVAAGEICGLIGPNGSGKTTLVNAISGLVSPTDGDVRFEGRSLGGLSVNRIAALGIRRTFQNVEIFRRLTVLENVLVGAHLGLANGFFASGLAWRSATLAEAAAVDDARRLLNLVGLDEARDACASELSFGAQRLLEIARALAARPRLLLLDEPAAGLSRASIQDLKALLGRLRAELGVTILLVEHVMALVMDVAERVRVLDCGRMIFDGTPGEVQADEHVRRVYLGRASEGAGGRVRLIKRAGPSVRPGPAQSILDTDVLVVGGGAGALRAALESASLGARTLVMAKGVVGKSGNTPMAGGGVQAVLHASDTPELHLEDILREAQELGSVTLARRLVEDAPARVRDLEAFGVSFQRLPDGTPRLFAMPGLSRPRNIYVRGGGWGLIAALDRELGRRRDARLLEDCMVIKLTRDDHRVTGALFVDLLTGKVGAVRANAVVLATGGYEALWSFTDASLDSTGEGAVAAFEAGAELVDLEMILFYPSVVCHPRALRGMAFYYEFVLSEALAGGRLLNGCGEEFLAGFPVRDRLCRAIVDEIARGYGTPHGGVLADLRSSPRTRDELGRLLQQWMPGEFKRMLRLGIDPREVPLEVHPGVHYCLGGVRIDPDGRTSVPGLFAAGEVAGNVHGANRLAGNALTETQVFGASAGGAAAREALGGGSCGPTEGQVSDAERLIGRFTTTRRRAARPAAIKRRIQELMWANVGLVRNGRDLSATAGALEEIAEDVAHPSVAPVAGYSYELQEALEIQGMLTLARLVVLAADRRKESRGHHYRSDYPETTRSLPTQLRITDGGGMPVIGAAAAD